MKIQRAKVYDVAYRCKLDHDTEEGIITAYWTGEIDTWGKYTFIPINGQPPLYLFKREIESVEAI